jgi:hypothetical protein
MLASRSLLVNKGQSSRLIFWDLAIISNKNAE